MRRPCTRISPRISPGQAVSVWRHAAPLILVAALACGLHTFAQTPPATAAPASKVLQSAATHPATRKKHPQSPKTPQDPATLAETHPPDPPPPDWPVNNKAVPASVDWNGRDLSISAANSSLDQILKDVSTATGVKVEGVKDDQRIFGSYGPAPARDVLANLLDGSGYNILMIGDQGQGTPRELVLTTKTHAVSQPGANRNQSSEDEPQEDPEPVDQPEPAMRRPGVVPPAGQGRSPEQFLQEMQQRRQQLQDQQQQQPQQGAPVQPPNTIQPQ